MMREKEESRKHFIDGALNFLEKIMDPLGVNDILKFVKDEKFYIEERFNNMRMRLKEFIDKITDFFKLDYFSERFYDCVYKIFNGLIARYYQFELDIAGIKNMVFKLYPIRKLISEHSKVMDVLSKY